MARTNPLKRTCPTCKAPINEPCRIGNTYLPRVHTDRAAPSRDTIRRIRDRELDTYGSVGA